MTSKLVVVSMILGLAASTSVWGQVAGKAAGGASAAAARVKTPADPTPSLVHKNSIAPPLTEENNIFSTVSIFSSSRRPADIAPPTGSGNTLGTGIRPQPVPSPVFRGVMNVDSGTVALIEVPDSSGNTRSQYVRVGETLKGATVLSISFESMRLSRAPVYAGQEPWVDVPIGCNLEGNQVGTLPMAVGTYGGAMANQPGMPRADVMGALRRPVGNFRAATVTGSPLDPALPPGSADDLATRMALRRQMQLRGPTGESATPETP
jgi:hypothetical protein